MTMQLTDYTSATDLDELGLRPQTRNTLMRAGIFTIAQLREETPERLLDLENMGIRGLEAISAALATLPDGLPEAWQTRNQIRALKDEGREYCETFTSVFGHSDRHLRPYDKLEIAYYHVGELVRERERLRSQLLS